MKTEVFALKRGKPPLTQSGFSLVETIAATGILALAAVPLMQISTDGLSGSANLEARFYARIVAENVLVEELTKPVVGVEAPLVTAGTSLQMGRSYAWRLTIAPAQQNEPQILTVDVSKDGQTQVLARLSSLRMERIVLTPQSETEAPEEEGGAQ